MFFGENVLQKVFDIMNYTRNLYFKICQLLFVVSGVQNET